MNRFAEKRQGVVAADGKTLRRSYGRAEGSSALHPVSAWAAGQRLVLGQPAVEDKSNEITAVPKLLELLALEGTVVAADAMRCQRQVAQQVIDQSADCALALKANRETLNDDVRLFPDDPATPVAEDSQTNKGHGRVETRTARVSGGVAWLQETRQWPGLKAVGKITAVRYQDDQTGTEERCCLLSQAFAPGRFNEIVRRHWGIENELRRCLDVVFNEDQARNRKGHCAGNMALMRKIVLNLARLEPSKGSVRGKLKRAGWDDAFLTTMLLQLANPSMRLPW